MDFSAIGPANTSREPDSPEPPTDAIGVEQRLSGARQAVGTLGIS